MAPTGFCSMYNQKKDCLIFCTHFLFTSYRLQIYIGCIACFFSWLCIKIVLLVVFLLVLNFLVTAPEANQLPGGSIGWSFGLTFLCILSEVAVGVAIFLERKNKHDSKKTLNTENETKSSVHNSKTHNLDPAMVNFWPNPHPRDDLSFSYRSSTGSLNLPSGSYCHIPDNTSIDTVSTDVVKYTEEPGSSKRGHLEWEVWSWHIHVHYYFYPDIVLNTFSESPVINFII